MFLEKYTTLSLWKRKISIKVTLVDNKELTIINFWKKRLQINEKPYILGTDSNEIKSVEKTINKL